MCAAGLHFRKQENSCRLLRWCSRNSSFLVVFYTIPSSSSRSREVAAPGFSLLLLLRIPVSPSFSSSCSELFYSAGSSLPCWRCRRWDYLLWSSATATWTARSSGRGSNLTNWSWTKPTSSSKSWSKTGRRSFRLWKVSVKKPGILWRKRPIPDLELMLGQN